jgi:hypothetical protein
VLRNAAIITSFVKASASAFGRTLWTTALG